MGLTAGPSYTTESGFVISPVYLNINFFRMLSCPDGAIQCAFGIQAYRTREDKHNGRSPISLPISLSTAETFIRHNDLYRKSLYGVAYEAAAQRWQAEGYSVVNVYEPGQATPSQYTYDVSGFNIDGLNAYGYNALGFDATGFNMAGYNNEGYDRMGYNAEGYNHGGFNRESYDKNGYDYMGFNRDGWDSEGFGRDGYNAQGLDRAGNPRATLMIDLSGAPVNLSGAPVDLSGAPVDLSGNSGPA